MYDVTICGIPAKVRVLSCRGEKPKSRSIYHCDCEEDYTGWVELELEVLDRKGYAAPWLERKLEATDSWDDLEIQVLEQMRDEADDV